MKFKKKKIYLIIFIVVINVISLVLIQFKFKENVYGKSYLSKKQAFTTPYVTTSYAHPFIGEIDTNNLSFDRNNITNEKLFFNINSNEIHAEKKTKILVLGGTVAKHLSNNSEDEVSKNNILLNSLSKKFPEKKFYYL